MSRCPTEAELLEYVVRAGALGPPEDRIGRHVVECPRCGPLVAGLRHGVDLLRGGESLASPPESTCLDELTITTLAERGLDSPLGRAATDHLLACANCRKRVADLSRLLRDDRVAAEIRSLEALPVLPDRKRWWLRAAGGLAAAAVLVLLVRTTGPREVRDPVYREEPVTLMTAPVPLEPAGTVTEVDSLSWRGVSRASQYRVVLFSQEGATVWESVTSDTVIAVPASVRLHDGATYYWKVEARTDWNRWTASEMTEIRIRRSP